MSDEMLCIDYRRLESVYGPLAESIRRLVDLSIRTEADPATVVAAKARIDSAADELSAAVRPGTFGVHVTPGGETVAWGNAVVGLRNPVAPPLVLHHEPDGLVWSEFTLGAAYEGPPEHVSRWSVCPDPRSRAGCDGPHAGSACLHRHPQPCVTGAGPRSAAPCGRKRTSSGTEGVKTYSVGHIADEDGCHRGSRGRVHPPQAVT